MRTARRTRGLSLLELLVSLGLVALLAGLALPSLQSLQRSSAMRAATRELLSGLQQVRGQSLLESRVGVFCPADAVGRCLPARSAANRWSGFLQQGSRQVSLASAGLPQQILLSASRSPLQFSPTALSATAATLTICDAAGLALPRAIVISQTGRVRVAEAGRQDCAS